MAIAPFMIADFCRDVKAVVDRYPGDPVLAYLWNRAETILALIENREASAPSTLDRPSPLP